MSKAGGPCDLGPHVGKVRSRAREMLPAAHHATSVDGYWTRHRDSGLEWVSGVSFDIVRDMTKISVEIDFGNYDFEEEDLERALDQSLEHLSSAVDISMKARESLTIPAMLLWAILMSGDGRVADRGWRSLQAHLDLPLRRRTYVKVSPRGIYYRPDEDKLKWQVKWPEPRDMRVPGARILADSIRLGGLSIEYDSIILKSRLPESVLAQVTGADLADILDAHGLRGLGITVRGHRPWSGLTRLMLRGPSLNMEEAFAAAARIAEGQKWKT